MARFCARPIKTIHFEIADISRIKTVSLRMRCFEFYFETEFRDKMADNVENTEKDVKLKQSKKVKKVIKTIKKLEFDDETLERIGEELQNTESQRLKRYKFILRAVIFEALFLFTFTLSLAKIFEFLRCLYNCEAEFQRLQCLHKNAFLFFTILVIFADILTIYGLKKWKPFYLCPAVFTRLCASLYFNILTLYWLFQLLKIFYALYVESSKLWYMEDWYLALNWQLKLFHESIFNENPWNVKEVQMASFYGCLAHYMVYSALFLEWQIVTMFEYAKPNPKIS